MNFTQFLYLFFWKIISIFKPTSLKGMFAWGIRKRIFLDDVKEYPNLKTELMGYELDSPLGVSPEMHFDIATTDMLVQMGAGFSTFGNYTVKPYPQEYQKTYIFNGKRMYVLWIDYLKTTLADSLKKLSARRYLSHLSGVSLVSFNMAEIKRSDMSPTPAYLHEYEQMTQSVAPYCDFIAINLSHPASPLYELITDESSVRPLIDKVRTTAQIAAPIRPPKIVLRVGYDLSDLEIKTIAQMAIRAHIDAIMISGMAVYQKNKGIVELKELNSLTSDSTFISGKPLKSRLIFMISEFRKCTNGLIPIIASGCSFSGKDIYDMICAGATTIELCESFCFDGPKSILKINAELSALIKKAGFTTAKEAIGQNVPINPNLTIAELLD